MLSKLSVAVSQLIAARRSVSAVGGGVCSVSLTRALVLTCPLTSSTFRTLKALEKKNGILRREMSARPCGGD